MDPSTHFFLVVFSSSRLTLSSGLPGQLLKKPFDILKHLGRSRSCNASVIPFFDKRPAVSMIRPSVNLFVHAVSKLSSRETCVPRGRKFSDNPSKIPLGYNLVRCCGPSASHRNFPRQLSNFQPAKRANGTRRRLHSRTLWLCPSYYDCNTKHKYLHASKLWQMFTYLRA